MNPLVLIVLLTLTSPAWALDRFYHYQTILDDEGSVLGLNIDTDPSYQSDKALFQKPFTWRRNFFLSDRALTLSYASLNGSTFQSDNRIKLKAQLNPRVDLQFLYLEDQDLEEDFKLVVLELSRDLNSKWRFSFYGKPSTSKGDIDFGVAMTLQQSPSHSIRFFVNLVDFIDVFAEEVDESRNQRGLPISAGLRGVILADEHSRSYFDYHIRVDHIVRDYFAQREENWVGLLNLEGRVAVGETTGLRFRGLLERRSYSLDNVVDIRYFRNRALIDLGFEFTRAFGHEDWNFESGLTTVYRNYRSRGPFYWRGDGVQYNRLGWKQWRVGWEWSYYRLSRSGLNQNSIDAGLSLRYSVDLQRWGVTDSLNARLNCIVLASLTPVTWGGGNVQFQMNF